MAEKPRGAARYEILGLLGTGGMGAVYRVRDLELGEAAVCRARNRRRVSIDGPTCSC